MLSGSCPHKLSVSVNTDKLARSGLIVMGTGSLGGGEPDNKTINFGRWLLGCAAVNWMTKFDG